MRRIIASSFTHKVVKQVQSPEAENLLYSAVATLWVPELSIPKIRLIYNNQFVDRGANLTVWALNSQNGIWGCFADQHDIGLDMDEDYDIVRQYKTLSPEQVEDTLCANFFNEAIAHVNGIYNVDIKFEPDMRSTFQLNSECCEAINRMWKQKIARALMPES